MARALMHRGPDEEGFWSARTGLASRRLSIVGLADGQQPVLQRRPHRLRRLQRRIVRLRRAKRGTEGPRTPVHHPLRHRNHPASVGRSWRGNVGSIARAVRHRVVGRAQRQLQLGRDRFGIAPLFWTRQGDWLLFASEIKGLLASGMVPARPDPRGIDHVFTFSAVPGPRTCFEGVQLLPPGHFLSISPANGNGAMRSWRNEPFWEMNFPDQGDGGTGRKSQTGWLMISSSSCCRRWRSDCGPMFRSALISPAVSIRA